MADTLGARSLIVFLVGSLILSGGQVSESTSVTWAVVAPYPLFVMPAGVLIALAGASVVLAAVVILLGGIAVRSRRSSTAETR